MTKTAAKGEGKPCLCHELLDGKTHIICLESLIRQYIKHELCWVVVQMGSQMFTEARGASSVPQRFCF